MHHQQKRRVIAAIFDAHGGPKKARRDPGDAYERSPTPKGEFVVAYCAPQAASARYGMSSIPWGTKVRRDPRGYELQIQLNGQWKLLKDARGFGRAAVEDALEQVYDRVNFTLEGAGKQKISPDKPFPDEWILNDFGHISCYYFNDVNGNKRQDNGEKMSQEVFHPTPRDEFLDSSGYASLIKLDESHGCIHVKPKDIDKMIAKGYLKTGNEVVVHGYTDIFDTTNQSNPHARSPYAVHFYPASKRLVVLGWGMP